MKKFSTPKMSVQRLEKEEIMRTSNCWESFDCKECYCKAVGCDSGYVCTGLVCPCLSALNW